MPISITQTPSNIQPAQSPLVFSVTETTQAYTASQFQYTANLYIWSGNTNASGSTYAYQLRKYPNQVGTGIFDFGRMVNSTLTDLAATNGSNIKYYKADFGFRFFNGTTYVTSSLTLGTPFKAYDGYAVFPDTINESLQSQDAYWPILSDAGVVTQSVLLTDKSNVGGFAKGLSIWTGAASGSTLPTSVEITASYENGTKAFATTALSTGATNSTASITHLPSAPADGDWGSYWPTTTNLAAYTFVVKNGSTVMARNNYEVVCQQYYVPVRIAYKNRYGQFDFINFYKRHNTTFNTDQRVYQPQLGNWNNGTSLSYSQFQTRQQRYIVDSTEVIECNTDFLSDGYNELMKQLLVSDEIYWCYDQINNLVKPLTIRTNSLTFKTGVNNKLVQYTIAFDLGQPYKLIL